MAGMDVVYANLSGQMEQQARVLVAAMPKAGVTRLIFISSMGVHDEVPGERYGSVLDPYRDSAALIEASDLDWTILRPGWFVSGGSASCRLTRKGEPFVGHEVSMDALSMLIVDLAMREGLQVGESLGVSTG